MTRLMNKGVFANAVFFLTVLRWLYTIFINFLSLPVVRNEAACGTNWQFML